MFTFVDYETLEKRNYMFLCAILFRGVCETAGIHVSHVIELFIELELLPKRNFWFSLIFLFGGEVRTAIHVSHVGELFRR